MKNTKTSKRQRTAGFGLAGIGIILMGYGISEFMKLNKNIDKTTKTISEQSKHINRLHQQFVDDCANQHNRSVRQHNRFVSESNMMHQQAVMQHQNMMNQQMQMMNMF